MHLINWKLQLSDFTCMYEWFCVFHKLIWFTSRTVSKAYAPCCFSSGGGDGFTLSTVALGQSTSKLRREGCSLQPALQEGVGSLTLVSLAPPWSVEWAGGGGAVSPDYIYNFRQHFMSHGPPVPRKTREKLCDYANANLSPVLGGSNIST